MERQTRLKIIRTECNSWNLNSELQIKKHSIDHMIWSFHQSPLLTVAVKIFMVLIGKFSFLYSVSAHKHWTIGVANLRKERSSMADIYQNLFKTERCMVKSEQVRTGNKVTGPAFGPKVFFQHATNKRPADPWVASQCIMCKVIRWVYSMGDSEVKQNQ